MTAFFGFLILVAICAAFGYGLVKFMEEPMDGITRSGAPGDFIGLGDGVTHYQTEGPENAPLIVLVHGLTTPAFVFDAIVPVLVKRGFRVLRYDLYGRGYSDRPRTRYDSHFYLRQLTGLLDGLGVTQPATFIGYSMGGCIVTALAASQPQRVKRLVLLASGGLGSELGPFMDWCTTKRGVGDWAMATLGGWFLRRETDKGSGPCAVADFDDRIKEETHYKGYMQAVLSSMRAFLNVHQEDAHRTIAANGTPVLAIWGEDDPVIPIAAMHRLAKLNPNARQVALPGVDHDLPHRHPEKMLKPLLG